MMAQTMVSSSTKLSRCPTLSGASSQSRCRLRVQAGGIWTPRNTSIQTGAPAKQDLRPKGYDRPWITANQPQLAPRTPEMSGDPFSLLLRQRTIFLGGEVEDFSADAIISQLLLLDSQDPTKPIKLFINSPGTDVYDVNVYQAQCGWSKTVSSDVSFNTPVTSLAVASLQLGFPVFHLCLVCCRPQSTEHLNCEPWCMVNQNSCMQNLLQPLEAMITIKAP